MDLDARIKHWKQHSELDCAVLWNGHGRKYLAKKSPLLMFSSESSIFRFQSSQNKPGSYHILGWGKTRVHLPGGWVSRCLGKAAKNAGLLFDKFQQPMQHLVRTPIVLPIIPPRDSPSVFNLFSFWGTQIRWEHWESTPAVFGEGTPLWKWGVQILQWPY